MQRMLLYGGSSWEQKGLCLILIVNGKGKIAYCSGGRLESSQREMINAWMLFIDISCEKQCLEKWRKKDDDREWGFLVPSSCVSTSAAKRADAGCEVLLTTREDKIVPEKKGEAVLFEGLSDAAMRFLMWLQHRALAACAVYKEAEFTFLFIMGVCSAIMFSNPTWKISLGGLWSLRCAWSIVTATGLCGDTQFLCWILSCGLSKPLPSLFLNEGGELWLILLWGMLSTDAL